MTAKEYLSQAWKMDRRLRVLQGKVEELRSLLDYRSPPFEGAGGGGGADRVPDTLAKIIEYEDQAEALRQQMIAKYIEIDRAVHSVPNTAQREVLERRYLLYQKWEQIAQEMNLDIRWVFRLHNKALNHISVIDH